MSSQAGLNGAARSDEALQTPVTFRISPLIRITLLLLYGALTIPLPFLPQPVGVQIPAWGLWGGIGLGAIALVGALTQRVIVDAAGIRVTHAAWVPRWFGQEWQLAWSEVTALKPRSTGQGGIVYYFLNQTGQAYLLPMRVVGFTRLVNIVQTQTGIDTTDVRPLAQPWMYFILLGCTLLLLLVDSWTIATAVSLTP